jgi:two-component system chemotaxis sensor kinase CheA
MNDLLVEFLTETGENLAVLDVELVQFEQDPHAPGLLSNIFRLVHTIKGTCGFLGLPRLEKVAHAGENVLGKFRDGDLVVTPPAISLILKAIDVIKMILGSLEATGAEPEGDDSALIAALDDAAAGKLQATTVAPLAAVAVTELADDFADHDSADHEPAQVPATMAAASSAVTATAAPEGAHREAPVSHQSIRVTVDLLENLMTTVSELVLTRNQLLQIARGQKETEFAAPLQRLNQVVSELQEGVMKTRMQPIGNAWAKLPRIIRDLSLELNKKIELDMRGAETELDRQVLELVKDPLTHMVRNSADHGIEMPEDRLRAGKRETGRVLLNAYHQGGHIIIEIGDDGRGLNLDRIKAKVIQNGLATEAELASLSDAQIQQYIFRAGFSTAEAVTSVSGRGVGMDVVKTNIEKIGGTVELKSVEGMGSTFTIKIPLTLAIVSALIVEVSGERYAVPQTSVVELVRATESGRSEHRIERVKETPVLRLRDRLLPLVVLEDLLQLERAPDTSASDERFVVVTQVGSQAFGMIVDRVFDTEEIVVKPVSPLVRHVPIFSGNTILGDGSVIMILDPNGIAQSIGEVVVAAAVSQQDAKQKSAEGPELTTLLVFRAGGDGPKAVPLSLIARLEEFEQDKIEFANGQKVIQYRGTLMPLISFAGGDALAKGDRQPALVFAENERVMGLLVDEIVDIVETELHVRLESDAPGMIGTAIVAGQATDLIDAGYFLKQAFPNWFDGPHKQAFESETTSSKRVLVVDDSAFFRNLLAPLLQVAGYEVTTASSAPEALALRDDGDNFDVIVSDIEMPGMSGFDFAANVKSDTRWQQIPVVALSSHAQPADIERATTSGFDGFVVKFDRNALLTKLLEALSDPRRAA